MSFLNQVLEGIIYVDRERRNKICQISQHFLTNIEIL